eukprot:6688374-Prymnesium_polylepis.4
MWSSVRFANRDCVQVMRLCEGCEEVCEGKWDKPGGKAPGPPFLRFGRTPTRVTSWPGAPLRKTARKAFRRPA